LLIIQTSVPRSTLRVTTGEGKRARGGRDNVAGDGGKKDLYQPCCKLHLVNPGSKGLNVELKEVGLTLRPIHLSGWGGVFGGGGVEGNSGMPFETKKKGGIKDAVPKLTGKGVERGANRREQDRRSPVPIDSVCI